MNARSLTRRPLPLAPYPFSLDSDLPALASREARSFALILDDIVRATHFDVVNRELRLPQYGGDYDVRPFPLPDSPVDVAAMKVRLRQGEKTSPTADEHTLARRIRYAFAFFMFGEALAREPLEILFGKDGSHSIDEGLRLGLFVGAHGQTIRMNGLSLFSRRLANGTAIHLFADTPPYFERRTERQRVYIGADSYELLERISRMRGTGGCCVEMGSGSGVQLISALKQHAGIIKAIGKETDRRAANVSVFNAALNDVADRMTIVESDLGLDAELGGCPISLALSNPPFLAIPRCVNLDPGDRTTVGELEHIRETDRGLQLDVEALFPAAGWGGDDGLEVTKAFIGALTPLLAPGTPLVIYSQFAGDGTGPTRLREYSHEAGFEFRFEPLPSRPLFSAEQAANIVARLVVSTLLAQRERPRIQMRIRTGSPEYRMLMNLSEKIQESYRTQAISHFHDGFAVLTKRPA